jgi:hypothetical protein
LQGTNFGLHPLIADTYNTGSKSHLQVDSALGPKTTDYIPGLSTPTLKLLSWNHTTIEFISPEGDGRNWDLSLTCGGQTNQKLDFIHYNKPKILSITPNENVMTDGRDGALIEYVSMTSDGNGYLIHEEFKLQPPKIGDVFTIYHCNDLIDNTYIVENYNTTIDNGNVIRNIIYFNKLGPTAGNWTGGYIAAGDEEGGQVIMTITGLNFGVRKLEIMLNGVVFHTFEEHTLSSSNNITRIGSSLQRKEKRNHRMLIVKAPIGVGRNLLISVRVGNQESSQDVTSRNSLSYRSPYIFSIEPQDLTTLGCLRFESPFEWEKRVSKEVSVFSFPMKKGC